MAAKKTIKTKRKASTARVKGKQPKQQSPDRAKRHWIEGLITILIGIYCYYAFVTAQPTIIDKVIGKFILMFLFGNGVPLLCLIVIASGILLMLNILDDYKMTIVYCVLISINFMIFLSIYIPNLNVNYRIIDLFDLAMYGGYGGIVGILCAYLLNAFITRTGTLIFIIALTLVELFLIFKTNLPNIYEKMKLSDFGILTLKDKYLDLKDDLAQRKAVKEEKRKQQLREEDTAELNIDLNDTIDVKIDDSVGEEEYEDYSLDSDEDIVILDLGSNKIKEKSQAPKKKEHNPDIPDYVFFMDDEYEETYKTDFFDTVDSFDIEEVSLEPKEITTIEDLNEVDSSDYLVDILNNEDIEDDPEETKVIKKKTNLSSTYNFPSIELLSKPMKKSNVDENEIKNSAIKIKETLNDFGVDANIRNYERGPTITRYEVKPAPGVKVSKITNLAPDLALALAANDIRMEAPIPGRDAIGIEVPNKTSDIVRLRELIDSDEFKNTKANIPFTVGKTLSGHNIIGDISSMPHLLIAGSTGSGKSVCINSIIISMLYHEKPEDLKMILIDPKMVELSQYNTIPHLLVPVVTDPDKAAGALNWAIREMEDRYKLFSDLGVRDLESYNQIIQKEGNEKLPRIVIIIDELADLMMTSPKEVESAICRIAQKARACGIHLLIATQRPSVDVITGLIKSNIPSRIAFAVASNTDSRTILDSGGAETLLGKGDMLYKPVGLSKPLRIQCSYVSDNEITNVIKAVSSDEEREFDESLTESIEEHVSKKEENQKEVKRDALYEDALEVAFVNNQLSTSMLQRRLSIGYARAGRIMDQLEKDGIISGPNGSKPRKLLISEEEYRGTNN